MSNCETCKYFKRIVNRTSIGMDVMECGFYHMKVGTGICQNYEEAKENGQRKK